MHLVLALILLLVLADTLQVRLYYSVYPELDVLTRSVTFVNNAAAEEATVEATETGTRTRSRNRTIVLEEANSCQVDFPAGPRSAPWQLAQLSGSWGRERQLVRRPLLAPGLTGFDSRRGVSSAQHNPFAILSQG